MTPPVRMLSVALWGICLAHVAIGLGLNLVPGFVNTIASLYGAGVDQWSPQLLYIVKPLGAFMLVLGVIAGVAARDPLKYRPVAYAFVALFIIRSLHRLVLGSTASEVFGIAPGRNAAQVAFFLALAALLVVLDQLSHRPTAAATA